MKKYILLGGLVWVTEIFTGPYAQYDLRYLLNSLPEKRQIEAKVFPCSWQNYPIPDSLCLLYRVTEEQAKQMEQ